MPSNITTLAILCFSVSIIALIPSPAAVQLLQKVFALRLCSYVCPAIAQMIEDGPDPLTQQIVSDFGISKTKVPKNLRALAEHVAPTLRRMTSDYYNETINMTSEGAYYECYDC